VALHSETKAQRRTPPTAAESVHLRQIALSRAALALSPSFGAVWIGAALANLFADMRFYLGWTLLLAPFRRARRARRTSSRMQCRGIDQKTGKPIDYDPNKAIQTYAGVGNLNPAEPLKKVCPSMIGGNNYWPSSYSPNTKLLYIPALTGCVNIEIDRAKHNAERGWNGGNATSNERFESNLTAVDPITQEIKKNTHLSYPNFSGALATGGGLVFLGLFDGTVAAFDATTLDELWKINVGTGFNAPPMTFEVNGK
jgi:PQQ-like domain